MPDWVGTLSATRKLRPHEALPQAQSASLDAARNEFEAFQVAVAGQARGRTVLSVDAPTLFGPGGARILADRFTVYTVGLHNVSSASNEEGDAGLWPDPLIPHIDPFYGEIRNAFPLRVGAGEVRTVWIELHVPVDAPPGDYTGEVRVLADDGPALVPIRLKVRDFALPSTSTIKSAFAMGWSDACVAHHGSYSACGYDAGVEHYHVLYARAALDHRISLESVVYASPADGDFAHFDSVYGPLLDGQAPTQLAGARMTSLRLMGSGEQIRQWRDHFAVKGWLNRLFAYTCDEPPHGCTWDQIAPRASTVQPLGIPSLVTTDLDTATAQGVLGSIDILTPVVQNIEARETANQRARYDAWLAEDPKRQLWWYQSCMSHGCGFGCQTTESTWYNGWPSYVIDASAIQARAMEWLSFVNRMQGELYFQTTHKLSSAWDDQCDFSGAGDGNLFYPGTPARIGGQSDIPIVSMRMKLIREGMEDYEYLALLERLGDGDFARGLARDLFPAPYRVTEVDDTRLADVRRRLADRIELLSR